MASVKVLAVDPGASSGWAIIDTRPVEWGVIMTRKIDSAELIRMVVAKAARIGATTMIIEGPYKLRLPKRAKKDPKLCPTCNQEVAEEGEDAPYEPGWKTYYSMGVSRGRWEQEARAAGLKVEEVNPRTWQAATVGTGPRKQQIQKYRDRAKHLAKSSRAVPADAAAAICIGDWYMIREAVRPPWG